MAANSGYVWGNVNDEATAFDRTKGLITFIKKLRYQFIIKYGLGLFLRMTICKNRLHLNEVANANIIRNDSYFIKTYVLFKQFNL